MDTMLNLLTHTICGVVSPKRHKLWYSLGTMDEEITPKKLASEIGVSLRTVYECLNSGRVPGAWRFPPDTGRWHIPSNAVDKIKNGDV